MCRVFAMPLHAHNPWQLAAENVCTLYSVSGSLLLSEKRRCCSPQGLIIAFPCVHWVTPRFFICDCISMRMINTHPMCLSVSIPLCLYVFMSLCSVCDPALSSSGISRAAAFPFHFLSLSVPKRQCHPTCFLFYARCSLLSVFLFLHPSF